MLTSVKYSYKCLCAVLMLSRYFIAIFLLLFKAKNEREEASSQLAELKLKNKNLEELLCTLRDGKGATKVVEWHKKMEEIRLKDMKLNRTITKLHEQIKYLENLNKTQENSLMRLEEENVRMTKVSAEISLVFSDVYVFHRILEHL